MTFVRFFIIKNFDNERKGILKRIIEKGVAQGIVFERLKMSLEESGLK